MLSNHPQSTRPSTSKQCHSITTTGERCKRNGWLGQRYCWQHTNPIQKFSIWTIIATVISICISIGLNALGFVTDVFSLNSILNPPLSSEAQLWELQYNAMDAYVVGDFPTAITLYTDMLRLAQNEHNYEYEIKSLSGLAMIYINQEHFDLAAARLQSALGSANEMLNVSDQYEINKQLADLYLTWWLSDERLNFSHQAELLQNSINYGEAAVALLTEENLSKDRYELFFTIGKSYYFNIDFGQAINAFQEACDVNEEAYAEISCLEWLGYSYYKVEDFEQAVLNLELAYELCNSSGFCSPYLIEKLGDVRAASGDKEIALELYQAALSMYQEWGEQDNVQSIMEKIEELSASIEGE